MKYCCDKFKDYVDDFFLVYVKYDNSRPTHQQEINDGEDGWYAVDGEMGYLIHKVNYCPNCGQKLGESEED